MKRYRKPACKPGQVVVYWGTVDRHDAPDICYQWGGNGATKRHANNVMYGLTGTRFRMVWGEEAKKAGKDYVIDDSFLEQLDKAGFDLTTLRFSIEVKKESSK